MARVIMTAEAAVGGTGSCWQPVSAGEWGRGGVWLVRAHHMHMQIWKVSRYR